ncbi:mitochondrial 37S ribosomal protein mS47 NDAI_0A05710 [Naumovozyma dairenensis CBS 421]|uniref:3-hydroxyisobutyryl-CoA hydrolase n=1 Tax=Naumovozyma dairenensis (strain ATCC 10597 / BCRC 20456 / CBS 421 / NBRC 0211 / NRRL Y-12639) TaxID=1071378 RepID=G0W4I8_NAUDC|nr:hypothetical protein NDAI_0A05710 [Naumovozyma dairenensis CBS 421]CCD22726.1 hypothetical protein NDAI_0A05710 [Naumovozyma dairenensis CBS 421]
MLRTILYRSRETYHLFLKRSLMTTKATLKEKNASPVLFTLQDTARVVTLNRPKKLNALNTEICKNMFQTLNEYVKSDVTNMIILKSSDPGRSFCAGGDVATVATCNLEGQIDKSIELFTAEYSLNFQLATYPKAIVSIMDGITMGGGVGLSIHTPFRVATENTKWAMPEMDIGFFPDVGTTFALPRLVTLANSRAQMALYLCLTGDLVTGEDAYLLGLSSHYINSDNLKDLEKRLGELSPPTHKSLKARERKTMFFDMINATINEFCTNLPKNHTFKYSSEQLQVIEKCFDINQVTSIEDIFKHLSEYTGSNEAREFCNEVSMKLSSKSVRSMQLAIKLIQDNCKDDVGSSLRRDLVTASNMCINEDGLTEFSEATRHKLIEKNKAPYPWKKIEPMSSGQLNSLLVPKPRLMLSLWKNSADVTWSQYPYHMKYQLPTEEAVKRYIKRNDGMSDNLEESLLTKADVVRYFSGFNELTRNKVNIAQYCASICDRKCTVDQTNGALKWEDS